MPFFQIYWNFCKLTSLVRVLWIWKILRTHNIASSFIISPASHLKKKKKRRGLPRFSWFLIGFFRLFRRNSKYSFISFKTQPRFSFKVKNTANPLLWHFNLDVIWLNLFIYIYIFFFSSLETSMRVNRYLFDLAKITSKKIFKLNVTNPYALYYELQKKGWKRQNEK